MRGDEAARGCICYGSPGPGLIVWGAADLEVEGYSHCRSYGPCQPFEAGEDGNCRHCSHWTSTLQPTSGADYDRDYRASSKEGLKDF